MSYKGYWATVEYVPEEQMLHGRVGGINDLITFEGEQVSEIEIEFHHAVDEYLAFCEETGKPPQKPGTPFTPRLAMHPSTPSEEELDARLAIGLAQAQAHMGRDAKDVFDDLMAKAVM